MTEKEAVIKVPAVLVSIAILGVEVGGKKIPTATVNVGVLKIPVERSVENVDLQAMMMTTVMMMYLRKHVAQHVYRELPVVGAVLAVRHVVVAIGATMNRNAGLMEEVVVHT